MEGRKLAQVIVAILLMVTAAFFIGRSSVTISEPVEVVSEPSPAKPHRITALPARGSGSEHPSAVTNHADDEDIAATMPAQRAAGRIFSQFHAQAQQEIAFQDHYALVSLMSKWHEAAPEQAAAYLRRDDFPQMIRQGWAHLWKADGKKFDAEQSAKLIASLYESAVAAGAEFENDSPEEIGERLRAGVTGKGELKHTRFQISHLSDLELQTAVANLINDEGRLRFANFTSD